jgi:hypothetical protein
MDGWMPGGQPSQGPHSGIDSATLNRALDRLIEATCAGVLPGLEPDQDVMPTAFLLDPDGTVETVVAMVVAGGATPREMSEQLGQLLRGWGTPGYIVQFMGWLASLQYSNEEIAAGNYVRPSQDPDRIEVLNVVAGSTRAIASRIYVAHRDAERRLVRLEERMAMRDTMETHGLFANLLWARG